MSKLRPECRTNSIDLVLPDADTLFLIYKAVAKRRSLIHGRLHDDSGHSCAMGAFWNDNPNLAVPTSLVDQVAAVNDASPGVSPKERWKRVTQWLRWKLKTHKIEQERTRCSRTG